MDMFEKALAFVLKWEGGYSDHPLDPGGATNYGITQATYDAWRKRKNLPTKPVKEITMSEVRLIYRERYWEAIGGNSLPPPLALAAFDFAVNSGVARAQRYLAEAKGDWRKLVASRIKFLVNLSTFGAFGRGWMRRVADLVEQCAQLEGSISRAARLILDGAEPVPIAKANVVEDKLYVYTRKGVVN